MCVIIQVPRGTIPSFEKFKNATLNNPDGFGIINKDRGKVSLVRGFDEKGNDPDLIYKQLNESKDIDRIIHLRKQTVGAKSLENVHPFKVLGVDGRDIWFFHNGTIGQYRPTGTDNLSDTRNFAENYLQPLLYKFTGEAGIGDFTDPFFAKLFMQGFGSSSGRALLVSNDLETKEFGDWKELKDGETTFRVSNNDYFDTVQYSRVHDARKEAQRSSWPAQNFRGNDAKTAEKGDETDGVSVNQQLVNLRDIKLERLSGRSLRASEIESLASYITTDFEEIDNETLSYFCYLTSLEISNWVESHRASACILLEQMFMRFSELFEEYKDIDEDRVTSNEKHEKATGMIATLKREIEDLKAQLGNTKATNRVKKIKDEVAIEEAARAVA